MPSQDQYKYLGIGGAAALVIGLIILGATSDNPAAYWVGFSLSVGGALALVVGGGLFAKNYVPEVTVKPNKTGF